MHNHQKLVISSRNVKVAGSSVQHYSALMGQYYKSLISVAAQWHQSNAQSVIAEQVVAKKHSVEQFHSYLEFI